MINYNRIADMQNLGGSEELKNNLQGNIQFSNININPKYFENIFSRTVKELDTNTDKVVKTSNSNSFSSDWRNNSSIFLQPMSKLEQFVLMTQGSKKVPATVDNLFHNLIPS